MNQPLNTLQLQWRESQTWGNQEVRILIDGRDLVELAREWEKAFAEAEGHSDIAGAYSGIQDGYQDEIMKGWLPKSLTGDFFNSWGWGVNNDKVALLTCGDCGEVGCWPLLARVTSQDSLVIWSDFEQPHRAKWKYDGFGPFVFDSQAYQAALHQL